MKRTFNIALLAIMVGCYIWSGILHVNMVETKDKVIEGLRNNNCDYQMVIDQLQVALDEMETKLTKKFSEKVTVTFYHPWSKGINSDKHPHYTATMTEPRVGRTIAISSELVAKGWLGRRVYIEGYGVFVAEDRMRPSLKGKLVDICVASKKEAFKRGKIRNVTICMLGD